MPLKDKEAKNEYMRKYMKERYDRRMSEALDYLGGECVKCGMADDLHFDHVDPESKIANVTALGGTAAKSKFWSEVKKCQLLCSSCHAKKTKKEKSAIKNRYGTWVCDCGKKYGDRQRYAGHSRWCDS